MRAVLDKTVRAIGCHNPIVVLLPLNWGMMIRTLTLAHRQLLDITYGAED